jgi:hypothetical protein
MAVYAPPKELGQPPEIAQPFDFNTYQRACDKFVQSVKDWAKLYGSSECRGEEIDFPVADGHARYIILSLRPVKLIHLPVGDGWQFNYAHLLRAADVRKEVQRNKSMAKMFSPKAAGQ